MGATCEPCEGSLIVYESEKAVSRSSSNDNRIPSISTPNNIVTQSTSIDVVTPVPQYYRSTNNLRPTPLSPSNTSMSLITAVCAALEAPEQIEPDVSHSMDEGELIDVAADALDFHINSLRFTATILVPMKGWLQKKQSAPPYSWQRRYVVVQDGYLLWSDREMTISDGVTDKEKKRWNKCINLKRIAGVTAIKSKKERKFEISRKNASRWWIWKASSKKQRDCWINGLSQHVEYIRQKSLFRASLLMRSKCLQSGSIIRN